MRRSLAIIGLVCLALAAVVGALMWTGRDVPVVMVHPDVAPERWQAYLESVNGRPPPRRAATDTLLAAVRAHNRVEAQVDPSKSPPPELLGTADTLRRAAWQFVQHTTPEDYVHLGRLRGLALVDALDALLKLAAQRGVEPVALLADPGKEPTIGRYVDVGGAFLRFAAEGGFIEAGALVPGRIPFLQAVFLHHWLRPLARRYPPEGFLRADEREWMRRWQLEWQRGGRLDTRLAAAKELSKLPDYPAELNAGVLLYEAERYADALLHFEAADGPTAKRYQRMARRRLAE